MVRTSRGSPVRCASATVVAPADADGIGHGLRRLPAVDLVNDPPSTAQRQSGIVMDVYSVSRERVKLDAFSFFVRTEWTTS